MTSLSSDEIQNLVAAHCYRVINEMDLDDLISYGVQMMVSSFDKNPGQGDTDVEMLIEDIWVAEGEDEDSAAEFISGTGITPEVAGNLMKTYQFQ